MRRMWQLSNSGRRRQLSKAARGVGLAVAALLLVFSSAGPQRASASASIHDVRYRLTGQEVPGGTLLATGVAVDNSASASAGDLYVASNNPILVDKFSPSFSEATYLCQITGRGGLSESASECDTSLPGPGPFQSVNSVAVDPASGLLYVLSQAAHRVYQLTPSGAYTGKALSLGNASATRLDVSASTGMVFVANETNRVVTAWEPGTGTSTTFASGADAPGGAFGSVDGVAVDNDPASPNYGHIYVVDSKKGVVDRLTETGKYQCQITGEGGSSSSSSECSEAEPGVSAGKFLSLTGPVTVDPTNGHLLVVDNTGLPVGEREPLVHEFDTSGNYLGSIEPPRSGWYPSGLNVDAATGDLFVASLLNSNEVFVFGPDKALVDTDRATTVTPTAATLNGRVNPLGRSVSECSFQFVKVVEWQPSSGEPFANGDEAPCEPDGVAIGEGNAPVPVHAAVSGLEAGRPYAFRIIVKNAVGTSVGEAATFGPPFAMANAPTNLRQTSVTLEGAVEPTYLDTSYWFEYGLEAGDYTETVPGAPGGVGSGGTRVPVSQPVAGLDLGTTYHYRIVAENSAGRFASPDRTFSTLSAALVDGQPAADISASSVDLRAYVDPLGVATSYHFEWGPTQAYGTPTPAQETGAGQAPVRASAHLSGLQGGTTYHFRLIASNANGTVDGPDETFTTEAVQCPNAQYRTGPSAQLPDCRAFEQVSPEEKGGGGAVVPRIGTSDKRVLYKGFGSFAGNTDAAASVRGTEYLATRRSDGWTSEAIHPSEAQTEARFGGFLASMSADLGESLWEADFHDAFHRAESGAILRRSQGGALALASPTLEPAGADIPWEGEGEFGDPGHRTAVHHVAAESADLSHVLFGADFPVDIPDSQVGVGDFSSLNRLYDITTGTSPTITLVNRGNSGEPLLTTCGGFWPNAAEILPLDSTDGFNIVSRDGKVVFFAVSPPGSCIGAEQLYARIDQFETVPISEPEHNVDCTSVSCNSAPEVGAAFAGASADGSRAFFLSTRQLTDEATEDPVFNDGASVTSNNCTPQGGIHEGPNGCNLYMYDFGAATGHSLRALSAGDPSGLGPQVQAVVRESEDGSRVYFLAKGLLTDEPNSLGQTAEAGAENLYLYDSKTEALSFVARLCTAEERSGDLSGVSSCFGDDEKLLDEGHSFTNESGEVFVFTSYGQLTPDDTDEGTDVYRFDARTGALSRISIGHDGFDQEGNGGGNATLVLFERGSARKPSAEAQAGLSWRPMSEDGSTVVFTTSRSLQAGDENGATDAYEWHEGEVSLVSGGKSTVGIANFNALFERTTLAISPSGHDIVFATDQDLVPGDSDGLADVYDVRIGGGFSPAAPPPPPCEGNEQCSDGFQHQPQGSSLGSEALRGSGNTLRCHRGQVKRHGRCVKRRVHRKKHRRGRSQNHVRRGAK